MSERLRASAMSAEAQPGWGQATRPEDGDMALGKKFTGKLWNDKMGWGDGGLRRPPGSPAQKVTGGPGNKKGEGGQYSALSWSNWALSVWKA